MGIPHEKGESMAFVRWEVVGETLGRRNCLTWLELRSYDASPVPQLGFAPQPIERISRLQTLSLAFCRCWPAMKSLKKRYPVSSFIFISKSTPEYPFSGRSSNGPYSAKVYPTSASNGLALLWRCAAKLRSDDFCTITTF